MVFSQKRWWSFFFFSGILVYRYRRFGGACCLHYQSNPGTLLYSFCTTLKVETLNLSETLDFIPLHTASYLSTWNLKTQIVSIHGIDVQAGNASLGQQVTVVENFAFRRQGVTYQPHSSRLRGIHIAQSLCAVGKCAMLPRMTVHTFRAELLPYWHADGGQPRHLHFSVMLTALWPEVDWPIVIIHVTEEREGRSCGHLPVFVLFIAANYFCLSYTVCLHSRRAAVHAHNAQADNSVLHVTCSIDYSPCSSLRSMQTSQKRLLRRLSRGWHYRYSYYELKLLNSFGEIEREIRWKAKRNICRLMSRRVIQYWSVHVRSSTLLVKSETTKNWTVPQHFVDS